MLDIPILSVCGRYSHARTVSSLCQRIHCQFAADIHTLDNVTLSLGNATGYIQCAIMIHCQYRPKPPVNFTCAMVAYCLSEAILQKLKIQFLKRNQNYPLLSIDTN